MAIPRTLDAYGMLSKDERQAIGGDDPGPEFLLWLWCRAAVSGEIGEVLEAGAPAYMVTGPLMLEEPDQQKPDVAEHRGVRAPRTKTVRAALKDGWTVRRVMVRIATASGVSAGSLDCALAVRNWSVLDCKAATTDCETAATGARLRLLGEWWGAVERWFTIFKALRCDAERWERERRSIEAWRAGVG